MPAFRWTFVPSLPGWQPRCHPDRDRVFSAERLTLLDLLVDVEAGGRVDTADVAGTGPLVRRVDAVVIEVAEGLGGELALP